MRQGLDHTNIYLLRKLALTLEALLSTPPLGLKIVYHPPSWRTRRVLLCLLTQVINVVTGYGAEAGVALASSKGIAKVGFTGSTATGTAVLQAAADNLIPATMELGGKSPNIFFSSIADEDDALLDKAVEGAVLFALNQVSTPYAHLIPAQSSPAHL